MEKEEFIKKAKRFGASREEIERDIELYESERKAGLNPMPLEVTLRLYEATKDPGIPQR